MDTQDIVLDSNWLKIADDGIDFKLTLRGEDSILLAYKEVDGDDPTVKGHYLDARHKGAQGYERRGNAPPGFVYAKVLQPGKRTTIALTLWVA